MSNSVLLTAEHLSGQFFSDGWRAASNSIAIAEPATGQRLARVAAATSTEIAAAASAGRAAQQRWAATAADERAAIFVKAAELGRSHWDEIIGWTVRESGSVKAKAEFELSIAIKAIQLAGAMPNQAQGLVLPSEGGTLNLARRRPLGVVGIISPFNFPLYLGMRAVAPALAVGNSVVLKPDPHTSICGGLVIARLFELAGLPQGVLHVLPGDGAAGAALCTDPNVAMIQFTGSTSAGRMVGRAASENLKKVSLELGGKNSLIILDDADMDLALRNASWATWLHQGQICMSAGRILVHEAIAEEFTRGLAEKARGLPIGNPHTEQVAIGPLINSRQRDRALKIVEDTVAAGGKLLAGGSARDLFFDATVLSEVTPTMPAFNEEIFGPVAVVTTFSTDEEAIALANDTDYGLSAAVISKDVARAMAIGDRIHAGLIHINDQTVNDGVTNPFGGVGASGNGMSIGGPANWELFTDWQWVTVKSAPPAYPF
ncbi:MULTISPECIES: benzaldehyde dehydrogenase [Rhizobium]|uniref:benzaldehyde dehydrogenase n=1 Tax=Rhizobium TaxID=379 RepID=UPI0013B7AD96|nr:MULTISPECIES: benzaldehyde dehydrogenase [Rhizobium]MBY3321502.1 benzaldehyde dehydrogenase [Rhizobium laguerreae]MBY3362784.1 benzaldehyde dehydrogenase [Rhizobium laguerreae]MCA2436657.1 benzaldehyde dehydrogenase [Rhizobium leguminosarum]NEH73499.1 aldehyde dehydrogenase family protein [Rhizobium leguminosarum]NKM67638.1 aldehyde dehydrogenase family protein [Rhizobium laguerreae]